MLLNRFNGFGAGRMPPASFGFDGTDDALVQAYSSTAADAQRRTFTVSCWTKVPTVGTLQTFDPIAQWENAAASAWDLFAVQAGNATAGDRGPSFNFQSAAGTIFTSGNTLVADTWDHFVWRVDTTQATADDRVRMYKNNTLLTDSGTDPALNLISEAFQNGGEFQFGAFLDVGQFNQFEAAFLDIVSGQSLAPTSFAFNNGGTWTARHPNPSLTFGTHGSRLDGTNNFNDVSGNGWDFADQGGVTIDRSDLPPYAT